MFGASRRSFFFKHQPHVVLRGDLCVTGAPEGPVDLLLAQLTNKPPHPSGAGEAQ